MNTQSNTNSPKGHHVIVGAGAVGSAVARLLADNGESVTILTRSGSGPDLPGIVRLAMDATDTDRVAAVCAGAIALYNCANPPYSKWETQWPPLAASLLAAAEVSGAVLVTMGNLYTYADPQPASGPSAGSGTYERMSESSPQQPSSQKGAIRLAMWEAAKAANDAGRVRATEARASDFIGAEVGANGHFGDRALPRLLKGKSVMGVGDPSQPHSWTAIDDVAQTLVTIATEPKAWGRVWHVPTVAPLSFEQLIAETCEVAGLRPVSVRPIPRVAMALAGLFSADIRELREMAYQFNAPFVIDSSDFTRTFGVEATPLKQTILSVLAAYSDDEGALVSI